MTLNHNHLNRLLGNVTRRNLIVVTPARNEQKMLPDLAEDIANQFAKPRVWVIVDDGSIDDTWFIIKALERKQPWICGVRLKPNCDRIYAHERYAEVVRKGFECAMEYCRRHELKYDFLALLDADVRIENDYFERMVHAFESDPSLGIASGIVYEPGTTSKELQESNRQPRGCALVFRRQCYEAIGGFLGHTNSLFKAKNRNWAAMVFASTSVFHRRKSASGRNYFLTSGKSAYFLNYHPINAFLAGLYLVFRASPHEGWSYFIGYFGSLITRKKKTTDKEISEYYWNSLNRLIHRIKNKNSIFG